jgi:hypothetical protein
MDPALASLLPAVILQDCKVTMFLSQQLFGAFAVAYRTSCDKRLAVIGDMAMASFVKVPVPDLFRLKWSARRTAFAARASLKLAGPLYSLFLWRLIDFKLLIPFSEKPFQQVVFILME